MSIKGKAYIAGVFEHPDAQGARQDGRPAARRVRAGRARRRRAQQGRHRRLLLRRRRARPRRHVDGRLHGPARSRTSTPPRPAARPTSCTSAMPREAIAAGKCNVALITLAGRPRSEGMATGTAPRAGNAEPAPDAPFEGPTARHRQHLRHVRDAPHARVRHHHRAARLDQGRRVAPRAAQSQRDAARGGHGRGRGRTRR